MRIFLSGAMGCYGTKDEDKASTWREKARKYLSEFMRIDDIINPMDYYSYSFDDSTKPSEIMRFDLHKIKTVTVVLVNLKDLDHSIGTSDEILYAYLNGIPVIGFFEDEYVPNKKLSTFFHPWKYEQITRIETGENALENALSYIRFSYGEE